MKCPHCDKELQGYQCPECKAMTPEGAKYCMECGSSLMHKKEDIIEDDNGFELEDRIPCPDGTCIGILIDGKCTDCGNVFGDKAKPK